MSASERIDRLLSMGEGEEARTPEDLEEDIVDLMSRLPPSELLDFLKRKEQRARVLDDAIQKGKVAPAPAPAERHEPKPACGKLMAAGELEFWREKIVSGNVPMAYPWGLFLDHIDAQAERLREARRLLEERQYAHDDLKDKYSCVSCNVSSPSHGDDCPLAEWLRGEP
jgi:hypothetical protein